MERAPPVVELTWFYMLGVVTSGGAGVGNCAALFRFMLQVLHCQLSDLPLCQES